ncbi:glycosyl transferase family 90 [Helicobacter mustelae]|uniref:Putative lipopolysaccharide core biosynthesis protein n=1 Tax=Helicobacter mustelae (strain ATCC 43772 / CCUG 25715 / CIP 103759 / LMG 18044 / NCTC 12198 / R85-136P) TaxID=679897 RepID=D3UH20_HELM1|nr:glycosyl transferase family 90 [Helicobacter mustelae]CBG39792.1 putative lipopolysaccharide core biosynthesis protein [Helicobacter mustelae 12198]SQH71300.1 lipopolysaccharide core biosynthesis protein [Helicobacter mustelae]
MLETFFHNLKGLYYTFIPANAKDFAAKIKELKDDARWELKKRLEYYCDLPENFTLPKHAQTKIQMLKKSSRYCYDFWEVMRYLDSRLCYHLESGDVNYQTPVASFCKSRPISPRPTQNILLKLDKKRHFGILQHNAKKLHTIPYSQKLDQIFFRGGCYQPHRKKFMRKFFHHPLINAGHTGSLKEEEYLHWHKGRANLATHLQYKFILSLEGNDVATNLKWILHSNSLALMPKPKFETWFMEGQLQAGVHYAEISEDYEDLESVVEYYLAHPHHAKEIIHNANTYTQQFLDEEKERFLGILVLRKFFYQSNQISVAKEEKELYE